MVIGLIYVQKTKSLIHFDFDFAENEIHAYLQNTKRSYQVLLFRLDFETLLLTCSMINM